MTEHDREEARLEALFDSTAAEPDRMQLTKLRARAAEVATRRRRPWWQLLVPVAAVAAVAFVTTLGTTTRDPAAPNAALASSPTPKIEPTSSAPLAMASADDSDLAESVLAEASMLADEPGDLLAPLDEPADDEAEVWLSAAGAFLEDG